MSSLRRHEGWLLVDHSASPGLPEDIARASGYDPKHVAAGKVYESATITCRHCGNAYLKNPLRTRDRAYCRLCDHYICDICDKERSRPGYVHMPFIQKAELLANMAEHGEEPLGSPMDLVVPTSIIVP